MGRGVEFAGDILHVAGQPIHFIAKRSHEELTVIHQETSDIVSGPHATKSIRSRHVTIVVLAIFGVFIGLGFVAFLNLGRWLVVQYPLSHADAILVLEGEYPYRAMEAAHLYHQGWARQVWLIHSAGGPENQALQRMGIATPSDTTIDEQILEYFGVPADAIHTLDSNAWGTTQDILTGLRELKRTGGKRLIIVTSKAHTRRVRATWKKLTGGAPEAIVRYTPQDAYNGNRWWKNSGEASTVIHEFFGLVNVWMGFIAKPQPE